MTHVFRCSISCDSSIGPPGPPLTAPRHLVPQPQTPFAPRAGLDGLIDSLLGAQHVLEMFRGTLPNGTSRRLLNRLSNRLTKILSEARKLATP